MRTTNRQSILSKMDREAYHISDDLSNNEYMSLPYECTKKWAYMIKGSDYLYEGGNDASRPLRNKRKVKKPQLALVLAVKAKKIKTMIGSK